ncbi:hypothetical protein N665_0677s0009 [Sinapis alba]|nr:hypothetical protein N665_0677s0009 [Sinapis alba]
MEELGLPSRLFETGFEPTGRKRVNIYFNLRWIELIKNVLDDDQLELLNESQFGKLLKMGSHTFSVMFLHYILSRQLVTAKHYELWWLLVGKPIPSTSTPSIWDSLFRWEEKPIAGWIMDRLIMGKKYKDPLTRLRLSLLVLVEGILCPTCGTMKIRPEVVSMLGNLDEFLNYPWGRESFLLTVKSTQARSDVHDTMAIQGFSHAMVLVTLNVCPFIIVKDGAVDPLLGMYSTNSEEIVRSVVDRKLVVNVVHAKTVDQKGKNAGIDVPALLRLVADAYEERLMPMFEGYMLRYKSHLDTKVSGLQREVKAAIAATRELDVKVTTEFDDNRKLIAGFGQPEYVHPQGSYSALEIPRAFVNPGSDLRNLPSADDPSCGRGKQPGGGETRGEEAVGEHPESMTAAHGTEEIGEPVGTVSGCSHCLLQLLW